MAESYRSTGSRGRSLYPEYRGRIGAKSNQFGERGPGAPMADTSKNLPMSKPHDPTYFQESFKSRKAGPKAITGKTAPVMAMRSMPGPTGMPVSVPMPTEQQPLQPVNPETEAPNGSVVSQSRTATGGFQSEIATPNGTNESRTVQHLPGVVPATVESRITSTGASPFNLRGTRNIMVPGSAAQPAGGLAQEVNPLHDRMMTQVPAGDSLLPQGAAGGLVIDPKYRVPGADIVASVTNGGAPLSNSGRIMDETGDRTAEMMAAAAATQAREAQPAVVPPAIEKKVVPQNPADLAKARSDVPVGPQLPNASNPFARSSNPVGPMAPPKPAEPIESVFSVRNFLPPPASKPVVKYGPPGEPVFKITGAEIMDGVKNFAKNIVTPGSAGDRAFGIHTPKMEAPPAQVATTPAAPAQPPAPAATPTQARFETQSENMVGNPYKSQAPDPVKKKKQPETVSAF